MTTDTQKFPIHVVICTHGRPTLLRRTLDSLTTVRMPEGFERVWVIENGSDSGARSVCESMQDKLPLSYECLPAKGKSRALQYALDKIGNGLVVFTDDDVRFGKQFLEAYAEAAAAHGPEAVYGGPVFVDQEKPPPEWLVPNLPPSVVGWQRLDTDGPIEEACFLGANYGAFVERINRVGGFKAHLGIGSDGNPVGEEFEIQDRLLADGCRGVYVSRAEVWHYVPRERSTPKWTLQRHERIWFTSAMMGNKNYKGVTLFGVPRWMWRRLMFLWMKCVAANLVPNARRRFEIQKLYYQWKGTVRGVRQRNSA